MCIRKQHDDSLDMSRRHLQAFACGSSICASSEADCPRIAEARRPSPPPAPVLLRRREFRGGDGGRPRSGAGGGGTQRSIVRSARGRGHLEARGRPAPEVLVGDTRSRFGRGAGSRRRIIGGQQSAVGGQSEAVSNDRTQAWHRH